MSDQQQALASLSIKELRKILQERNINFADCIEKQDLVQRIIESDKKKQGDGGSQKKKSEQVLHCLIRDFPKVGKSFDAVVIVMHGYRAHEGDLSSIVDGFAGSPPLKSKRVRYVFPRAPLEVDPPSGPGSPGGYSWWPLDLQALMMKMMTQGPDSLFAELPIGVDAAREQVFALIEQQQRETGLPLGKFVIGGFSQGAMLAAEVAFSLPKAPGGLLIFSGALLNKKGWERHLGRRANDWQCEKEGGSEQTLDKMHILQCHGRQDPILVFQLGQQLTSWLKQQQQQYPTAMALDVVHFNGGHTLPPEALPKMHQIVVTVAGSL